VSGSSATQPAQPVESSERGRCPRLSKIPTRLGKSKTAWWFQWMGLGELTHRKTPYLMGKSMVSCRFSLQSSGGWNPTQSSHLPIGLSQHKNGFFYPPNTPDAKGCKLEKFTELLDYPTVGHLKLVNWRNVPPHCT